MNKKFSTLLVGALLTTSLGAFAQGTTHVHTDENKIGHGITLRPTATASAAIGAGINHFDADKLYQLTDADGKVLIQTRNYRTGELNLKLVNVADAPINASLWSIKVTNDNVSGVSYTMTNKETNLELVYAHVNATLFNEPTVTSTTNLDASILEGCLTNWTWYSTISQNTNFDYKPIYSYFANRDSVVVLQKNLSSEIIAAKYSKEEAETDVEAITDAVKLKPVLAGGIILTADDLNRMVDFQYDGTFGIVSAVAPNTESPLLTNTFTAVELNDVDFPVVATAASDGAVRKQLGLSSAAATTALVAEEFVYLKNAAGKVLSVGTEFYSSLSKELPMVMLDDVPSRVAIPDGISHTSATWEARSLFRFTYYPSNDSLLIEPMNAMPKNYASSLWQNADFAFNSVYNDLTKFHTNTVATPGRANLYSADNGPVAVRIAYLTEGKAVITAKNTETNGGIALPGSLQTKFTFKDRNFKYLSRVNVDQGLYFITDVATGKNVVDNFIGRLMLDAATTAQDYNDMPATMWVVKTTGCGAVPTVAIYNREYADEVFEGQLYKDEKGIYFINRNYRSFRDKELQNADTYTFAAVEDNEAKTSPRHGYKHFKTEDLLYTKYYMNYNLFANQELYLNVSEEKSFAPTPGQATTYELTEAQNILVDGDKAIDVPFGYGAEIGLPQLARTAYVLKVSDKNLIDNDKIYVYLVSPQGKTPYYKAMTKAEAAASAADQPKLGVFYLKADQVKGDEICYVLVDINSGNVLRINNGWMQAHCEDGVGEMSYLPLDNVATERATAFAIITDNRPLYMDLGEVGKHINMFRARGTGSEFLFEDSNNQSNAPQVVKDFGYLGMTAEKIQPIGKESKTAIYADYVVSSTDRMPQYLFVLRPDSVKDGKWCNTHGYNPNCEHEMDYNGYLAGSFLINLTDSVKGSTNMLNNPDVYKWQSYTRLGFVEGVHQVDADGEYLYILKDGRKLADLKNKDGVLDPRDLYNEAIFEKKPVDGLHKNYAFSLRFTDDDHKDFLLESNLDEVSHIASFKGAWVKIHNGVPVLAEYTVDNGNHEDDDKKMQELINQAQIFNLEDTSDYATSNEGVSTSGVSVIAGEGTITILNATGKTVTVSNILGQTVTVQNITSDNATITAPAGIVVVAVDGESAVKAIVK
ncbi:DUF6383 domain-containing protein [Parabacteroides timonensis]|uniref:DUF6383 domain-containing protein n=1 Tax=Parabacteroides timonensis TaxID=1871013 RepID=UPI00094F16D8|nr:DUF6383 domain-containing protein [Parabacteroides timonensis]